MCGIAGVLRFDGAPPDPDVLQRMTDAVAHRGPDGAGTYLSGPIALGHRRLSIIDLSDAGAQPLANEDGTVRVSYNGEIYNFAALREELVARGHAFRSRTDTEVIVHAYEEWGVDCLARFNGMFAFALWDERLQRLWLVRDRLGVKPLFYASTPTALWFGSEVKAVLAAGVERRPDYDALGCYLTFNYIPAPHTLLEGVRQLRPGHYLLATPDRRVEERAYWDVSYEHEDEPGQPEARYLEELDALLSDSVRLRLVSDVPLGVFLSGGVDSSGVAYWMARHRPDPVLSFSIGFADDSFDETPYAREVAASIGAEHRERMLDADAALIVPEIVRHAEEPTADSSMVAVYHLARLAREHVTVVQSGDGADELFAGYETYQAHYLHRFYRRLPAAVRRGVVGPLVGMLPPSDRKVSITEKLQRFVAAAERSSDDAHATWRMIFDEDARRRLLAPVAGAIVGAMDPLTPYREAFSRSPARHPLNRLLYVDTRVYLPSDMLVKVDRMTMAHGLEAREPYLDYRLVEFAARVPPRLKLRRFTQKKYLLRQALEGKVPGRALHRKKQGFNIPNGQWMRAGLRDYVDERLSPSRARDIGLLNPAAVAALVDAHMTGRADHSHQLWSLLVLSEWCTQFGVRA
jgi:asparagine synthase (glutamine-hydrolysing)